MGQGARHARRDRARRGLPRRAHGRAGVPRADRRREPAPRPHVRPAEGRARSTSRASSSELPREAQEIKPHPHGVELGMLHGDARRTRRGKTRQAGARATTSRASRPAVARADLRAGQGQPARRRPTKIHGEDLERLHKALGAGEGHGAAGDGVVPIGEELLIEGLKRRFPKAEFYVSTTRPPSVYRGNPFVVEVGLAYGGDLPVDEPAEIMRFANRVPLQYQPKACAISESVYQTNWRSYELQQPKGSLPGRARWRSSCTSRACGCRSPARRRRPSPTTTSCSRR